MNNEELEETVHNNEELEEDYFSFTEKVFAFKPRWREGRDRRTREVKIRERSAANIYGKRLLLAETFSQTTGDNIVKEMNKTLSYHELNANLYQGVANIVSSLAQKEGGIEYVRDKMRKEVEAVRGSQRRLRTFFFWNFYIFLFINIVKITYIPEGTLWEDMFTISALGLTMAFFFAFTFREVLEHKKIKAKFIGDDDKPHNDFTKYQDAMMFDI